MMPKLFEPYRLGGLELPNRIVVAPMCQYSSEPNGRAGDWHLIHWGQYLIAGAGLMMIEATAVSPEGRITPGCLGLYDDETEAALRDTLGRARRFADCPVGIQLGHAGRKGSMTPPWGVRAAIAPDQGGWGVIGPSDLPFNDTSAVPRAMSSDDIEQIIGRFSEAAKRALRCGVDLIEVHCAHGYLLSSFLSPLANRRSDAYGGSLENRMRLPLRVFEAVRAVTPTGAAVGVRLNGSDWVDGGITQAEAEEFARRLARLGCDFIDVSSGGNAPASYSTGPGYQLAMAAGIRNASTLPTMAVGMIKSPTHAEAILLSGQADLVLLARGFLNDPRWVWHAAEALGVDQEVVAPYRLGGRIGLRMA
ncbi:MAG: NADH:flavin oxidoreductase/NADH oxidase [Pararhodobacter sp.]|nr:NADH:flavin oxidoreductase/NADH oxidase [Pararhodobacter sp.]